MQNLLKVLHGLEAMISNARQQVDRLPRVKLEGVLVDDEAMKALETCAVMTTDLSQALNNVRHVLGIEYGLNYRMRERFYCVSLRPDEEPSPEAMYGLNSNADGPWSSATYAEAQASRRQFRNDMHRENGSRKVTERRWVVAAYDPKTGIWRTYTPPPPTPEEIAKFKRPHGVSRSEA